MAKQRFGINDGYRGTVGTVIGYMWCGKWCLRSRPQRVHNPKTERQQRNRGLFAAVSQLASAMGQALRVGMRSAAWEWHRTAYNHFLSVNNPCFAMEEEALVVDYEHLLVSQGPVAPVGFALLALREEWAGMGRESVIPFERNPLHLSANGDDLVYLYAWCPEVREGLLATPSYRRSKQVSITLPERWADREVHLYGWVVDVESKASDSVYLGSSVLSLADEVALVGAGGQEGCCGEEEQQQEDGYEGLSKAYAEGQPKDDGGGSCEGQQGEPLRQSSVGILHQQRDEQQGDQQRREQQEDPLQGVGIAVEVRGQGGQEGSIEQVAQKEEQEKEPCHKGQVDGCEALHRFVNEGDGGVVLRCGFCSLGGDGAGALLLTGLGEKLGIGGLYAANGGGGQGGPQHQLGDGGQGYATDFAHHELYGAD